MSTSIVAIAEMGDKTQLLSFVLAAKFNNKLSIILGILLATLANHFAAGYVGAWLASLVSPQTLRWIVALSFFAFGAWALVPDKLEENQKLRGAGVFITTLIAFFLVEMRRCMGRQPPLVGSSLSLSLLRVQDLNADIMALNARIDASSRPYSNPSSVLGTLTIAACYAIIEAK